MTVNAGTLDRALRIVAGLALLACAWPIGFSATGWNRVGWIGVIPLLTGLFGNCPVYSLPGISTCPVRPGR
jgi:hypothetical protein